MLTRFKWLGAVEKERTSSFSRGSVQVADSACRIVGAEESTCYKVQFKWLEGYCYIVLEQNYVRKGKTE